MNVKEFIEENKDLILGGSWDKFYSERGLLPKFDVQAVAELNKIFEGSGILYTSILHGITRVPPYFLYGCEHIPNPLILLSSIKKIESAAFEGCDELISIVIPDSVKSIGPGAFGNCSNLTSVTIGNSVRRISELMFSGCSKLTGTTIPNGVISIGYGAFLHCSKLKSIIIPDSVISIGDYAFAFCKGLVSMTIGSGVADIGYGAFFGWDTLERINFQGTRKQWESIRKNSPWGPGSSVRVIHCIDGDIEI